MRTHPLLLAILAVLPSCSETLETEGCVALEEDTKTCPAPDQVSLDEVFLTALCGDNIELVEVKGPGTLRASSGDTEGGNVCCYPVEVIDHEPGSECNIGRPFLEDGAARVAPIHLSQTQQADSTESDGGLAANTRGRALAWAHAGAAEHASVAAFSRLSLQLLALGAPLDLIEGVQRAALDEVHHARACWALAQTLSGSDVAVGTFPFERTIDANTTLAGLAYAAVREGCLAETLGACVAQSVAALATEDVRAVLTRLASEEADHAVLSFRIVSWALQVGGESVRGAITRALDEPWPRLDTHELALRAGVSRETVAAAARSATARVLKPAARALIS